MKHQYNKGSEWRRWDLHIHTPCTNKCDEFSGSSEDEKWDNFYKSINEYCNCDSNPTKNICVIGITDYLSIDNYLKVKQDNKLPECIKLVLPNIELRMLPTAKQSPVNIHFIFNPDIAHEIEERFLHKLSFKIDATTYSATKSELIRFGKSISPNQPDDKAYRTGVDNFVLNIDQIEKIFNEDRQLREKTIIIVSNSSNDGASFTNCHSDYFTENGSQLDGIRKKIYQLSDMVFSSNPNDKEYFTGEGQDSIEEIKRKCRSLKPCVHGCDAHTNSKIFAPNKNRFCWIKADPTFEGLKQVLYEPKDRVCIQDCPPDQKLDYHVIDSIKFSDDDNFSPYPIYFNQNLTCIIGGKSTGKSLLLHSMANAIDPQQVLEKTNSSVNIRNIPQVTVAWRDDVGGSQSKNTRKIVYIPQTYLNRLSDENEETTEIDKIIEDIALQNEAINIAFQERKNSIEQLKEDLSKNIIDLLKVRANISEFREKILAIGDKAGIEAEITKVSEELTVLSKTTQLTPEEMAQYNTASRLKEELGNRAMALKADEALLFRTDSLNLRHSVTLDQFIEFKTEVSADLNLIIEEADKEWTKKRLELVKKIRDRCLETEQQVRLHEATIQGLKSKVNENSLLQKLSEKHQAENKKLLAVDNYTKLISEQSVKYDNTLNIIADFKKFKDAHRTFANVVTENMKNASPGNELEFRAEAVFRTDQFQIKINNLLNNKNLQSFRDVDLRETKETDLSNENLKIVITAILTNPPKLNFKNNTEIEHGLRQIVTDWYNVNYIVKMGNDEIKDMSPGKKALVLLRLLISLAENSCPILIDQPEDDLDNRSIFEELIAFIKEKKVNRQIIIVTHNANVVLGGDSELVIVANQQGNNSPNETYRFEYRAGSIENVLPVKDESQILKDGILNSKGIQNHICEILEGGVSAFELRKNKYYATR